jgi:hypothetical protein
MLGLKLPYFRHFLVSRKAKWRETTFRNILARKAKPEMCFFLSKEFFTTKITFGTKPFDQTPTHLQSMAKVCCVIVSLRNCVSLNGKGGPNESKFPRYT